MNIWKVAHVFLIIFTVNTLNAQVSSRSKFEDGMGQILVSKSFEGIVDSLERHFADTNSLMAIYADSNLKTRLSRFEFEQLYYFADMIQMMNPHNPEDPYDLIDTVIFSNYNFRDWAFCRAGKEAIRIAFTPTNGNHVYLKLKNINKLSNTSDFRVFHFIMNQFREPLTIEQAGEKGEMVFEDIQVKILQSARDGHILTYRPFEPSEQIHWAEAESVWGIIEYITIYDEDGNITGDSSITHPFSPGDIAGIGLNMVLTVKKGVFNLKTNHISLLASPLAGGIKLPSQPIYQIKANDVINILTTDEYMFLESIFERGIQLKLYQNIQED